MLGLLKIYKYQAQAGVVKIVARSMSRFTQVPLLRSKKDKVIVIINVKIIIVIINVKIIIVIINV